VGEAIAQVEMKRHFMRSVMQEGVHYDTIPGATRPTLLRSGAEVLLAAMSLHAELADGAPPVLDYAGLEHAGEAFIEYRRVCRVYRQTGLEEHHRMLVAQAEGTCNSWETKYRWRETQPECPDCGKATVFRSKQSGGWFCWRKRGGCGANMAADDPRINGQAVGRVPNPDVADLGNTILKMADKRALVAAARIATGCSDLFTESVDESEDAGRGDHPSARPDPASRSNGAAHSAAAHGSSTGFAKPHAPSTLLPSDPLTPAQKNTLLQTYGKASSLKYVCDRRLDGRTLAELTQQDFAQLISRKDEWLPVQGVVTTA
jgi:predicted RNA-binding Zn-ribbon protein involved in translation (DUF1610 family)